MFSCVVLLLVSTTVHRIVDSGTATPPTVTVSTGATLVGVTETNADGKSVNKFLGIPYADAPVGATRWTQSTLASLTGNVNAMAYGSNCYGDPAIDDASRQFPRSENCLFLNVFAPAQTMKASKLPVMVWVHGGSCAAGTGNAYDGSSLVRASGQRLIIVTFNYRLGALGFLSNDEILAQGDGANFGLRDQETAFRWVQQYIAAFGGDPTQITAFGESAGAVLVAHHLLARDGNQTLFQRAILQSGGLTSVRGTASTAVQAQQTASLAAAAPASAIVNHFPTIDKVFVVEPPYLRLLRGNVSRVPTISGTATDDGWHFAVGNFSSFLRSSYPDLSEADRMRFTDLYPASAFPTAPHRAAEVRADDFFVCAGEILSSVLSETVVDTYRYRFNYPSTTLGVPLVLHADDLDYLFDRQHNRRNTTDAAAVVGHVQRFWTTFAITGSPNTATTAVLWPRYDVAKKQQLLLQPTLAVETDTAYRPGHARRCAFWYEVEARLAPTFE